MKFFKTSYQSKDELKKDFRLLCLKLHPDKGGDVKAFRQMFDEYKEGLFTFSNSEDMAEEKEAMLDLNTFEKAQFFKNLLKGYDAIIEISFSWLWFNIAYNPEVIAILKSQHCKWSHSKKMWYWFANIENSKKSRGSLSKKKRRQKYGSKIIKTNKAQEVA